MTDFRALFGLAPTKSDQKKASVAQAAETKREALDPAEVQRRDYAELDDAGYAAKYGPAAMLRRGYEISQLRQQEAVSKLDRTVGEHLSDLPSNVGRMVNAITTGAAAGAIKVLDGPTSDFTRSVEALAQMPGAQAIAGELGIVLPKKQRIADMAVKKTVELGMDADRLLRERMTFISQADEQLVERELIENQRLNRVAAEAAVAAGESRGMAAAERIAGDIGDSVGTYLDHPTALSNAVVGQLPMLALGPAARGLVSAEGVAARVASKEAAGSTLGRAALEREARQTLAERNLVGLVTASESVGNFQQTAAEVIALSPEQLIEQYPEARERIAAGEDIAQVQSELAQHAGAASATITAPIAALSSRLAAKFELNPLTGGAAATGASFTEKLAEAPINLVREGVEEALQGGGGQFASNLGQQVAGDADVDLAEGVGAAAGQGLTAGVATAGAFQSPGLHLSAIDAAAKATGRAAANQLAKVDAALNAGPAAQEGEQASQVQTTSDRISEQVRTLPPEEQGTLTTPAAADTILAPETQEALGLAEDPSLDRVSTLGRVLNAFASPNSAADKGQMALYALKTVRELRGMRNQLLERAAAAEEGPAREAHADLIRHIGALANSEPMRKIEEHFSELPEEELEAVFNELPDTVETDAEVPAATQRAIETVLQMAYTAPDRLPAPVIEKALFQTKLPADQAQLQLALDFSKIADAHKSTLEALQTKYPKFKTSDVVRQEITEKGFQLGHKKLKSVADYMREISRAMGDGEVAVARLHMQDFGRFAQHMSNKAEGFDAAAIAQLEAIEQDPTARNKKFETSFKTLDKNGKLTAAEPAFVNLYHENGQALIDAIFADAGTVASAYNAMAKTYPQLAPKLRAVTAPAAPKWKSHTPVSSQETAPDEGTPAPVATTDRQPVEVAPVAEASATPTAEAAVTPAPVQAATKVAPAPAAEEQTAPAVEREPAEDPQQHVVGAEGSRGTIQVGKTRLTYDVLADEVRLNNLTTPKNERGRGQASKAMEEFVASLDAQDLPSILTVAPMSEDTTAEGLQDFYSRHGYAVHGVDPDGNVIMRRPAASVAAQAQSNSTMAGRFAGLRAAVSDTLAGQNQFLKAFRISKASQAVFARFTDPVQEILSTLRRAYRNADAAATRALFGPKHQYLELDTDQMQAVGELLSQAVPAVANQLNLNLQHAAHPHGKNKGFLKRFRADPSKEWSYTNRKTLHVTQDTGDGDIVYQPKVAQAMSLAGLHWALTMVNRPVDNSQEKIDALFPQGVPDELRDRLRTSHFYVEPVRDLARQITQIMGLSVNPDAPVDMADGMAKQLAADTINALHELGFVTLHVEQLPDSNKVMTFIEFNRAPEPNKWKEAQLRSVEPIRQKLRQVSLLTRMLMPDTQDVAFIGQPPTRVASTVQGGNQPLSSQQRTVIKNHQTNGYTRNVPLLQLLGKLGAENTLNLFGFMRDIPDVFNAQHKRSVEGINNGLLYGWNSLEEILIQQELYAQANDMVADEVPVYFGHEIIKNNRVMATSFGPQRNKLAREVLSVNHAVLDLTDPQMVQLFLVAAAQGLGMKVERKPHAALVNELTEKLSTPEFAEVLGDLLFLDQQEQVEQEFVQALIGKLQDLGIDDPRKLHVLLTYARFQQAKADGNTVFQQALSLELDGITDGPVNANVHFGLHHGITEHTLRQLRQGGWIISDPARPTMNEQDVELGDIYGAVAERLVEAIHAALGEYTGQTRNVLIESLRALHLLGHLERQDGELAASRSVAKHPVTSTVYGSGERAVVTKLAHDLLDLIYAQLSNAALANEELTVDTQRLIQTLMGQYEVDGGWAQVQLPNLQDPAGYKDVRFSRANFDALVANLRGSKKVPGVGKMLVAGVQEEMAPILETFQTLYKVSALQTAALRKAYEKAYATKHAELVAAGELLPNNGLSRNQEQQILAGLRHLMPVYKLLGASGQNEGLNLSTQDTSGKLVLEGKEQAVTSIAGNLRMDINATWFPSVGVNAASMYTIALGDASMMAQMFASERQATNVYDGYEATLTRIQAESPEINEAVFNGWQFDALGAVLESYEQMELDPDEFSDEELQALFAELRVEPEGDLRDALRNLMTDMWQDLVLKKFQTRAYKQALSQLHSSVDHMASGMQPFVHEGRLTENLVEDINRNAASIFSLETTAYNKTAVVPAFKPKVVALPAPTETAQEDEDLAQRLGLRPDDEDVVSYGAREFDREEIELLLSTYTFKDKTSEFVVQQLLPLLPDNLRLFVGAPDQIATSKAQEFPGVYLGGPNEVGTYYDNTLFLSAASPETLAHELVHATTLGMVSAYYRGDKKKFTSTQLTALADLESLTREFLFLDPTELPAQEQDVLTHVQTIVRGHLAQGDMASAVNEYMAWSLTNPALRTVLKREVAPPMLSKLVKSFLKVVRKLLGLPNNMPVESFLEATLGRFRTLTQRARGPFVGGAKKLALKPLYQSLTGTAHVAHQRHLEDMLGLVQRTLLALPREQLTEAQVQGLHQAFLSANNIREQFAMAGFDFTEREQLLFELTQALLASGLELDPVVMATFQELHATAMEHLKVEDFLDTGNENPTSAELSEAQDRYNALWNVRSVDTQGRSNLLANFVALALVHQPLHDKLATLRVTKRKVDTGNLDKLLRSAAQNTFDKLSDTLLHIGPHDSQQKVLGVLMARLAVSQEHLAQRLQPETSREKEVENLIKQGMTRGYEYLTDRQQARLSKSELGAVDGWINGFLLGARGLLSKEGATAFAEGMLSTLNTSKLPQVIRELFAELVGITDSNAAVAQLLTRSKHVVARVRQRLRDEGPGMVREMFSKPLPKETWSTLHRMAQADLQALQGSYTADQIIRMLEDSSSLATATTALENRLRGSHQAAWLRGANHLADWLVHRTNADPLLARNANALAALAGRGVTVDPKTARRAAPFLDRLVSLYAIQRMSQVDRNTVASLMRTEQEGMQTLLTLLKTLAENERGKPGADDQRFNAWKGYVPVSLDPRTDLVLAGPNRGKELVKQGYTLVEMYEGDPDDVLTGLAYYATNTSGGQATFNQGAMQTIEGTVAGVDRLTGQSLDPAVKSYISDARTVQSITKQKRHARPGGRNNLLPVFNDAGEIIAYERVLDHALIEKHLNGRRDLSQAIGSWMGRQAEESLARGFNAALVDVLKKTWDDAVLLNKEDEFVDVSRPQDKVLADVWGNIPRETQSLLKATFGSQVMVRKDMLHNALGYRSASFADVFTGATALPEEARKAMETAAFGLLGKNAYKILVTGERTWQGLVTQAKDWIVVRSGVVALANGFANQFQLLASGVPITRLVQTQARKIKETEQFLRNERRLAQLQVAIAAESNQTKRKALEREGVMLNDANKRLSIWPLVEAGELPSIAEGLAEQDEYSILADALGWVERKMEKLPKGLSTAARYAIISKDTALYQGLNRMIQFGDFMAKATLYEHLVQSGKDPETALRQVNETFVNYNLLPGRSRDYLESMGLTWFLNYKLRIQKIILRTLRDNPIRFLLAGVGAEMLDVDSLVSSAAPNANLGYAVGPGQFFRADNMLVWRQLF